MMAQEVRIDLTCDACTAEGIHNTEAETLPPIATGTAKPRLIDLCETHRKELFDPLADLLARDGRLEDGTRRRKKRPAPEPEPEPTVAPEPTLVDLGANVCPDCSQSFNTAQGLNTHWTRKHAEQAAKKKTAKAQADGAPTDTYVCPDCGKGFDKAQGLGAHRSRSHGYRKGDDE